MPPPEHPSWKKLSILLSRCRLVPANSDAELEQSRVLRLNDTLWTLVPFLREHFDRLATFQITGSTDEPEIIELPVQLTKNSPRKFALREKRDVKADAGRDRDARKENGVGLKPALWIDWVEWEGPLDVSNESGRKVGGSQKPTNQMNLCGLRK